MPQYRKGNNSPWIVQIRDVDGNIQSYSFEKKEDALECEYNLRRIRKRLRAGLERPLTRTLFFDFASDWLKRRTATLPRSTWEVEESRLRRDWMPLLGNKLLVSIRRSDIEAKLNEILVRDSGATRNRHRAMLHTIFNEAIRQEPPLLTINPVTNIEILSEKKKVRPNGYWKTESEVESYIQRMYEAGEAVGCAATTLAFCGVRIRELLPLRWGDVDDEAATITIERIVEAASSEIVERTKGQRSGGSYHVPLWPRVKQCLERLKAGQEAQPSELIFLVPMRKKLIRPLTYKFYSDRHYEAIAKAKLPPITPHGLRHTCSTLQQKAGITRDERKALLGHSDARTTDRYSHADLHDFVKKATGLGYGIAKPGSLKVVKG